VTSNRKSAATSRRAREIARTRQDIVEAAARVFGALGYHAATMQAIAAEAGFTAASLYTYFRSKDEIYGALVADMKRAMLATFDEAMPAGLTLPQRLELLLHRQLALIAQRRDALRVAFQMSPGRSHDDETHDEFVARLTTFLADDVAALRCPPPDAARLFFGLVRSVLEPWILGRAEPAVGRDSARLVDFFLNGVARSGSR
jgi:AcrR family transcriptional regulator